MLDLDEFIERLLLPDWENPLMEAYMTEKELNSLCKMVKKIFLGQPIVLNVEAPVKIVGDICAHYNELLAVFRRGGEPSSESSYLFLGNYVNRGLRSLETIALLFAYKARYPANFFLLRGNQETAAVSRLYGFYDECKRRYSTRLWLEFIQCFECMPLAAVIQESIFCVHGGLSPQLDRVNQISCIRRPADVPKKGLLCDLLWSDPDRDAFSWAENDRGISFAFSSPCLKRFMKLNNIDLVVRGHQVAKEGFEFFVGKKLLTLFSAANYCDFNNDSTMLIVQEDLECSLVRVNHRMKELETSSDSQLDKASMANIDSVSDLSASNVKNPYKTVKLQEQSSLEGTVKTSVTNVITTWNDMPPEYKTNGNKPSGKIYDRIYAKYGCKAGLGDSHIPQRADKQAGEQKTKRVAKYGEVLMMKNQAKESCIEKIMETRRLIAATPNEKDGKEEQEIYNETSQSEQHIDADQEPTSRKQISCPNLYKPERNDVSGRQQRCGSNKPIEDNFAMNHMGFEEKRTLERLYSTKLQPEEVLHSSEDTTVHELMNNKE